MKVKCTNCGYNFQVPAEYVDKAIKCPKCKKTVEIQQPQSINKPLLSIVILVVLVGVIGFSIRIRQLEREVQKTSAMNAELRIELEKHEQLKEKQIATLESEIPKENTKIRSSRPLSNRAWEELGFPKFAGPIPRRGKVTGFSYNMAVGDYGGIASPRILQILGPYEMIISGVSYQTNYGKKEYTARIKGFSTKDLVDDRKWLGNMDAHYVRLENSEAHDVRVIAEIAIIGTWTYTTTAGSQRTIFTAIPLDFVREGLTEAQFKQLLK